MGAREYLYKRISEGVRITAADALAIWEEAPLATLMYLADNVRRHMHPGNRVGWMIDRNVNITNICFSQCRFCNFCRTPRSPDAYVTTDEEYDRKISELTALGGDQLLLQGGMNPAEKPVAQAETACPRSAGDSISRLEGKDWLPRDPDRTLRCRPRLSPRGRSRNTV